MPFSQFVLLGVQLLVLYLQASDTVSCTFQNDHFRCLVVIGQLRHVVSQAQKAVLQLVPPLSLHHVMRPPPLLLVLHVGRVPRGESPRPSRKAQPLGEVRRAWALAGRRVVFSPDGGGGTRGGVVVLLLDLQVAALESSQLFSPALFLLLAVLRARARPPHRHHINLFLCRKERGQGR